MLRVMQTGIAATLEHAQTITGIKTFNTGAAPFAVGADSADVFVDGLNADMLDGVELSDVARLSTANTFAGVQTIPNTGLHILDTNASHDLILAPGSDLTADRTLTLTTGDADRTVTLSGNLTVPQTGTAALTGLTLAQFAATTSAQLAGVISDETGSDSLVFATSPTLTTPKIAKIVAPSDGTTAVQVTKAGGTAVVTVDTTNGRVGIGATPSTMLHISGAKNTAVLRLASTTSDSSWSNTDYIGAIEFYSADASNGGAGVVGSIKVLNDTATTGNRVGMLFTTRGTASGVTNNALYIDEVGNIGSFTLDPIYGRIQLEGVSLGTMAGFAFTVIDGVYNPRAIISHVTSTTDQYVKFESAFSSGSGLADWVFSNGNVAVGLTAPTGKVHIDQSDTGGAIPVLVLDQGDTDQDFIELVGTSGTGNATNISTDAAGVYAGRMQITVNGTRRWIQFYADA